MACNNPTTNFCPASSGSCFLTSSSIVNPQVLATALGASTDGPVTVGSLDDIPLQETYLVGTVDISHIANSPLISINKRGTYLVIYKTNAQVNTQESGIYDVAVSLEVDGVEVPSTISVATVSENDLTNLSGSYILNVSSNISTTVNLRNAGEYSTFYTNVILNVTKVS